MRNKIYLKYRASETQVQITNLIHIHVALCSTTSLEHDQGEVVNQLPRDDLHHSGRIGLKVPVTTETAQPTSSAAC